METFIAFIYAAILAGVPLLYGTLGEIITEKAKHHIKCLGRCKNCHLWEALYKFYNA